MTNMSDITIQAGQTLSFFVQAVDAAGETIASFSEAITVNVVPSEPQTFTIKFDDDIQENYTPKTRVLRVKD